MIQAPDPQYNEYVQDEPSSTIGESKVYPVPLFHS
jgi:hypothetical protein